MTPIEERRRADIHLDLTRSEVKHLASLQRNWIRKKERSVAKSTFVPEPGRTHAGERAVEAGLELLGRLEEAMGETVQVWEDEVWEDEAQGS